MTPGQKIGAGLTLAGASLLAFVGNWESGPTDPNHLPNGDFVAYEDVVNVVTVCKGHTDPSLRVGDVWTKEQCDALLVKDVTEHGQRLLSCITVPINQHIFDGLSSWAFNVGTGAACKSTLIKLLNQGRYTEACNALLAWDRAGGKRVRGLTNRRKAERELCLKPMENHA